MNNERNEDTLESAWSDAVECYGRLQALVDVKVGVEAITVAVNQLRSALVRLDGELAYVNRWAHES